MTAAATAARDGRHYALLGLLLAVAVAIQLVRDRGWHPYEPASPLLWVQSGAIARALSPGFANVAADGYWIRAVVYYGGQRRQAESQRDYSALFPLLDLVTALDPHFRVAYRFGAIFLTEPPPDGPGRPDQAIALLERGIARDGGRWEYYHDIGFIHYWWRRDYQEAARWFLLASERPGAAEWLKPLAATTLIGGGNRESSRLLWRQMQQADMEYLRTQATHRLAQLDTLDVIDALSVVLQRFIDREGRTPRSWAELAAAERLGGIPTDAAGMPFYFDPAIGRIDVSRKSPLWPLPGETPPIRVPAP